MIEDRLLPEEKLLVTAAELPVLSDGLRSRVLAATCEARTRRSQGRKLLWAAGILFLGLGLLSWYRPPRVSECAGPALADEQIYSVDPSSPAAASVDSAPAVLRKIYEPRRAEWLMLATGDDWQLIEAELQRRKVTHRFQHSF